MMTPALGAGQYDWHRIRSFLDRSPFVGSLIVGPGEPLDIRLCSSCTIIDLVLFTQVGSTDVPGHRRIDKPSRGCFTSTSENNQISFWYYVV